MARRPPPTQAEVATTNGEIARGNLDGQIAGAEMDWKRNPKNLDGASEYVELLLLRAQFVGNVADLDRALAVAEAAVAAFPDKPAAYLTRASARAALHEFAPALADLDEADKHGGKPAARRRTDATILHAVGRYDEALVLRKALRAERADVSSIGAEAALLADMGRAAEAEATFAEALGKMRGTSPFPLAWLFFQEASMAERAGDDNRARELFRAAHDRLPAFAHATAHLASFEPLDHAIELLRPLADQSDDPEYAASIAGLLRRKGDGAAADAYLAKGRAGFDRVVAAHPAAYADHAAWFWSAEGGDPKKAVELAKTNTAVRKTERAFEVLLVACAAANDKASMCAAAREAATLKYASESFRTLVARSARGCP